MILDMRLIAYSDGARAIMARVMDGGTLATISSVDEFWCAPDTGLAAARQATPGSVTVDQVEHLPPVPPTAHVLCAGRNYAAHAAETNAPVPQSPDLFGRWPSTLTVSGHPVPVPPREDHLDWEGELAVVVGSYLRDATVEQARVAIIGYLCFNDLSARGFQRASARWTLGKNADFSAPIGPWLVTADDIPDPDRLRIVTRVNSEVVQDGCTEDLIFSAPQIAAYASGCMTLRPGDVITTGTPAGVGFTRQPPRFLHAGDTVEVEIDQIGRIVTPIVAALDRQPG
jgi:2-keto-4-pentenoate hydratase/2-oxohepta-3-ene-1,7-dioic acid hydratase in catechol pathway